MGPEIIVAICVIGISIGLKLYMSHNHNKHENVDKVEHTIHQNDTSGEHHPMVIKVLVGEMKVTNHDGSVTTLSDVKMELPDNSPRSRSGSLELEREKPNHEISLSLDLTEVAIDAAGDIFNIITSKSSSSRDDSKSSSGWLGSLWNGAKSVLSSIFCGGSSNKATSQEYSGVSDNASEFEMIENQVEGAKLTGETDEAVLVAPPA